MYTDHRTIIEKEAVTASGACNLAGAVLLGQHKAVYMTPLVVGQGQQCSKTAKKQLHDGMTDRLTD